MYLVIKIIAITLSIANQLLVTFGTSTLGN